MQITDFENAAIVCFVVLLTRVILSYKLNLLIPISKVDENMARAQKRDAVRNEKFWFRRDITSDAKQSSDSETEYTEFTVNEIINGKVCDPTLIKTDYLYSNFNPIIVLPGGRFSWSDTASKFLFVEHGCGCGHTLHRSEVFEIDPEKSIR